MKRKTLWTLCLLLLCVPGAMSAGAPVLSSPTVSTFSIVGIDP